MNYIFLLLISISLIIGFVNGRLEEVNTSLLTSCNIAVKIAFSLIGIMAFWLGIMRIAEKAGIINIIAKILKPITKKIFSDIPQNSPAIGDIAMSISANALGLTNAATPIGIKAMQELQEENKNKTVASDSMCMFLGMNTAGFQIIPATVIAILTGLGAKNPTDIILPTLIVTTISFIFAILISLCLKKIWHAKENHL
ncbi:MAG: nucleoside recognition domain-containing protein [bacterium]|nr:nucleoside recognition domain-containing protein [bacterium]